MSVECPIQYVRRFNNKLWDKIMKAKTTLLSTLAAVVGMLVFSACGTLQSSSGPSSYIDDPQEVYDAVEASVRKLGMKVESSEIRDNDGFRILAVDDNARVLNTQSASAARLQRIYITAEPRLDGSLHISVDVPSGRNYGSMSASNLRSDFFKHLNDQGLTPADQLAANDDS